MKYLMVCVLLCVPGCITTHTSSSASSPAPPRPIVKPIPSPPPPVVPIPMPTFLGQARKAVAAGQLKKGRALGFKALEPAAGSRNEAEAFLTSLHDRMVFSKETMVEKGFYRVVGGDSPIRITRKLEGGTTSGLLMRMNRISDPRKLQVGQHLQYLKGTWSVDVDLSRYRLVLRLNGRFFKSYPVAVGAPETPTPTGAFTIRYKAVEPTWFSPKGPIRYGEPGHEIGSRWIGWFRGAEKTSYGIHGTSDPASIGRPVSHGCVRLRNEDVEDLYDYLPSDGSVRVTVSQTSKGR